MHFLYGLFMRLPVFACGTRAKFSSFLRMLHQLQRILLLFVLFWVASFSYAASPPDVALVDVVRSPDPVSVGADLTYKVIVVNNGETVAAGVQITNRLDA